MPFIGDNVEDNSLRVVSTRTAKQIEMHRAANGIKAPLRALAANLLRVLRGSGQVERIASDCVAVLEAYEEHRRVLGTDPSGDEVAAALHLEDVPVDRADASATRRFRAEKAILSGALQIAASSLLAQPVQRRVGETEMLAGARLMFRDRDAGDSSCS